MEYFSIFITVATIHFLGVISPGPDFILITRNSIKYSRKTGIYTAFGLGLGILLHVAYSLIGIGLVISQSIIMFNLIKIAGASYLIYLGYKSVTSSAQTLTISKNVTKKNDISSYKAIKMGFLTNATNPKVTLFFLSIFTLVIKPTTPLYVKLLMGLEMQIVTVLWFSIIAFIFTHHIVQKRLSSMQAYSEKIMGIALIALGLKLAFTKK